MRNVRILAASLLLFISSVLTAQIRESVVLVEPKLSEDGTAVFREIASFFKSRGLGDLGEYFEERSKNKGSGSGYFALDPHGRRIIVTNRHVMAFANSASATITREEGENLKLEDCPLLYEDPNLDLAVLLVPDSAPRDLRTLPFADAVPADGTEVWTAGYPGLLGKPSWQLAKGVVSNRRVVVEDLGPAEYAVFTQHSAPIDPGNSGGPLLIGNPADLSTIRVVGINTWMVRGRQNANFAVHLDKLKAAIGGIRDPGKASDGLGHVREEAARLAANLNGEEWNRFEAGRYISTRLAMRQGWASFKYILDRPGNEDEKKQWAERFLYESPEETLRQAVYYRITQSMRRGGASVTLGSVEEGRDDAGEHYIRATFTSGRNTYYLDWFEDSGTWRIRSGDVDVKVEGLDGTKVETTPGKQSTHEEKYRRFPSGLIAGIDFGHIQFWNGFNESVDPGYGGRVGYFFSIWELASFGPYCTIQNELITDSVLETLTKETYSIGAGLAVRFGFGFDIGKTRLYPFFEYDLAISLYPNGINAGDWIVREETLGAGTMLKLPGGFTVGGSFNIERSAFLSPNTPATKYYLSLFVML